jgi:hypothetical protein
MLVKKELKARYSSPSPSEQNRFFYQIGAQVKIENHENMQKLQTFDKANKPT